MMVSMELYTASLLGFSPDRHQQCGVALQKTRKGVLSSPRLAAHVGGSCKFAELKLRMRPGFKSGCNVVEDVVPSIGSEGLQWPASDFRRVSAPWSLSGQVGSKRERLSVSRITGESQSRCPLHERSLQSSRCCQMRSPKIWKRSRCIVSCHTRVADVALHSHIQSTRGHPSMLCRFQSEYHSARHKNVRPPFMSMDFSIPGSNSRRVDNWKLRVGVGEDLPPDYQDDDPVKKLPRRRCGILLHPSSLPGAYGIGELGKEAFIFLDWLKGTGCTVWQVLPLVPPGRKGGEDGSPYAGNDANCGNTLLISLDELVKDGLLDKADLPKTIPVKRVNYTAVATVKDPLVTKAAKKLVGSTSKLKDEFEKFRKNPRISAWLEEAALFASIDQSINATSWWAWPPLLRDRDPAALSAARHKNKDFIDQFIAAQFLFQRQWQAIHNYANAGGIKIVGDMPIYVGGHSADVWAHRSLFALDPKTGAPTMVSGVPPDAFSATGQLWGSPLYNWKEMAKDGYSWWATRMRRAFELYDEFRIDHFRGLAGYWAVPATAETAMSGKWKAGPGVAFFKAIKDAVGKVDIIAEDLGVITSDVVALRRAVNAPGMAVLQFAFGSDCKNPHLPHNHELEQVVYPGTHDNDTCVGWWKKVTAKEKEVAKFYLQFQKDDEVHWEFIKGSLASVARTTIIPMQDVMGLDNTARMNTPATQAGNWGWRVGETGAFQKLEKEKLRLHGLLSNFNRLPRASN